MCGWSFERGRECFRQCVCQRIDGVNVVFSTSISKRVSECVSVGVHDGANEGVSLP